MKLLAKIEKTKDVWFLILTSFVFFLLRLPSLFEPYWYGDEGIYQVIGRALQHGQILYKDIWDNKPPLLYFLYMLFSSDQFTLRAVSLLFGILSVVVFYLLAKHLLTQRLLNVQKKQKTIFIITGIFAFLFATPFLEGNIANAENFMILPILISALIIVYTKSTKRGRNLFVAGLLLSIAFLFKVVAVFDFASFALFLFIINYTSRKHILLPIKTLSFLFFGFLLPILFISILFVLQGSFVDFLNAAFKQNVSYVGYGNNFLIPQGFLIFKLLLLGVFVGILFAKRRELNETFLFTALWLSFSLFNAFFSGRPYTHYILVLLPALSLFIGLIFQEKKYKKVLVSTFIMVLFFLYISFHYYNKTLFYYHNFISLLLAQKKVTSYQEFFDKSTPTDYKIAQFINAHSDKKDALFIWGNNAQVYMLTSKLPPGRFTVAYHMTATKNTLQETSQTLSRINPKFIVIMPKQSPIPYNLGHYELRIYIDAVGIYERVL